MQHSCEKLELPPKIWINEVRNEWIKLQNNIHNVYFQTYTVGVR
jgi:hypothetical protein